ncbi:beta-hexosaminidase 1 isoform X2 [Arctopsyche grandis]|uniref:beta-hexosaminidase 1 isoform X2 n=1 Tax=Arctopsyche grandis TaxID=121162 RepID=UPI00406D7EF2
MGWRGFTFLFLFLSIAVTNIKSDDVVVEVPKNPGDAVWRWECIKGQCEKLPITDGDRDTALSLGACKMFCNEFGNMWPRPSRIELGNNLVHMNRNSFDILLQNTDGPAADLMRSAIRRFRTQLQSVIPPGATVTEGGRTVSINVNIRDNSYIALQLDTDESYTVELRTSSDGRLTGDIRAENFFGARNALETLIQFAIFDDIRSEIQMVGSLLVEDKPYYPYRGILLDTSRNFFSVDSIKRTLDAMAISKLNTFHWHITDSHSFSFVSKSNPNLSKLGAITPYKVYSAAQIIDIVRYGLERGIRVMPEFDAPAHVGEGWQGTNLTVCFRKEPWQEFCVEPPCGQFDVTKDALYDVLQGIYNDMFELFKPDIFHMGGDEVHNECWNSSAEIQNWMKDKGWGLEKQDFFKLWEYFQQKAQANVFKSNNGKKLPLILWTSTLTEFEHIDEYLSNEDYIIQIWTTGTDPEIAGLLNKGYRLIISNYDALYFDCGFGAWVGEGNNWCSPYIGWQKVYDNSPKQMAGAHGNLILGGEAALWAEQADTSNLDNRLWPRAGAMAERLWAEPNTTWRSAERRMLHYRERLVNMGVLADSLQPEWCYQNEGYCYA